MYKIQSMQRADGRGVESEHQAPLHDKPGARSLQATPLDLPASYDASNSIVLREHRGARQRPTDLHVVGVHADVGLEEEGRAPQRRREHRAMVHGIPGHLVDMHRVNVADGHLRVQLLHLTLGDVAFVLSLAVLPSGTLHEEAVDVHALGRRRGDLGEVPDVVEAAAVDHEVQRQVVGASCHLHVRGQEAHRVEQARQPDRLQQRQRPGPLHKLLHATHKIGEPSGCQLERWIRFLRPQTIHLVGHQVGGHCLHVVCDVEGAADAQLKLNQ
mmetsp:Transcript_98731/g.257929  ORF Transcript_98731/g.257929 Transcript_98731/m.257929 type:complete len:271 (+) Transcript_98731:301-1113(+)